MFEHHQRLKSSLAENLFAVDVLSPWSGLLDVKCFSNTGGGGFRIEMLCSHPSSQSTWTDLFLLHALRSCPSVGCSVVLGYCDAFQSASRDNPVPTTHSQDENQAPNLNTQILFHLQSNSIVCPRAPQRPKIHCCPWRYPPTCYYWFTHDDHLFQGLLCVLEFPQWSTHVFSFKTSALSFFSLHNEDVSNS